VTANKAPAGRPKLTLYSRTYCHLCDDMLAALEHLRGEHDFDLAVVDVDADPALEAKFDERVPVLEAEGRELCHYHLDLAAVRAYLVGFR
jgi:glutaredoxin